MQPRKPRLVSVVAPVFNNAREIPRFVEEVSASLDSYRAEIILVDDGSDDNSWKIILEEKKKRRAKIAIRGIRLSRNFGQHRAICAGLSAAGGEYVFVLDADLQDDPVYMRAMLAKAQSGYEVVHARRKMSRFSMRNLLSRLVYLLVTTVSEIPLHPGMGNFKLLHRKAVAATLQFSTFQPLFELMVANAGFRAGFVDVVRRRRSQSTSSYNLRTSLAFVFGMLVNYSSLMFCFILVAGFLAVSLSLLSIPLLGIRSIQFPPAILIAGALMGLVLLSVGILGLYLRNIQAQIRGWPPYIIAEKI